ncbi:MAG: hypothetical protein H6573_12825 [Lewinellaceae bacterium]|nr:hypothetical protein [Phaeodactylibacter sp.]MCB0612851.1 hypothetical protein [Phaeodactylibacter sp.]MCB9348375.1 hypothetical protein [Lewinellaceae bacterium]
MRTFWLYIYFVIILPFSAFAQSANVQIRVFDVDEGLSHRKVVKILQDSKGFIWMATIDGLNRFDGYQFLRFKSQGEEQFLPHDAFTDMLIDDKDDIWLSSPDFITIFQPESNRFREVKVKQGEIVERQSIVPQSLFLDSSRRLWMAAYDENSAENNLRVLEGHDSIRQATRLEGSYPKHPGVQVGDTLYVGAYDRIAWKLNTQGNIVEALELPPGPNRRISQIQVVKDSLFILCMDGTLFTYRPASGLLRQHPMSFETEMASALLVEPNGNIWAGGRGKLLYYDQKRGQTIDYGPHILEAVGATCTYRQIFQDRSGVIWVASDFGAIKILHTDPAFTQYLSGRNEYCSSVYCSTRGITEDEAGNIYISYYSAIHVLEPDSDNLRPLFPSNDFFNYPFGLTYFKGALYTGNGKRIDLKTLRVDTLLNHPSQDLGHVLADKDSLLWIGFMNWLYQYDPEKKILREFQDSQGKWDSLNGNISYLYQGKTNDWIWVATLSNGIYKIDKKKGRLEHYHAGKDSPVVLRDNQVNALYEDGQGQLWIASAQGLLCLNLATGRLKEYTTEEGLSNNFINGILPEGDSCIWASTDNGLCRLSIKTGKFNNFFVKDGLSANEFNRISFYRSRAGRMYFGGLNGVNAFLPGPYLFEKKEEEQEAPIIFTRFSKFDGRSGNMVNRIDGLSSGEVIIISPWDRFFSFEFSLADYRQPIDNVFSCWLEGYENDWLPAMENHSIRYNNIPAGTYTFRVRSKVGVNNPEWNSQQLAIRVVVQEAFYNSWWFWLLCAGMLAGGVFAIMRYRIYLIHKREMALEQLVRERTQELELEKQKSEELLLNILPAELAEELKKFGAAKAKRHELVTVMFSDFKGFSRISEQMDPEDLVAEIDYCFRAFDEIMEKYGLEKIKTVGDAYLCVGGIRDDDGDEATRVILAAMEIQEFMAGLRIQREAEEKPCFEARIGIHTGAVVAGIVGIKKFAYDIWGDTVNLAARMETNGDAGKVNISETTYDLTQKLFRCTYHGQYTETDGEDINMYYVEEYLGD